MTNPYLQLIPRPSAEAINSGLSPLRAQTQRGYLGMPRQTFGRDCQPVTNDALKRRIITATVGPFRVTGFDWSIWSLQRIMADVRAFDPVLYANLGTAGMLCCRLVRGSQTTISNHSWGIPIDLTVFKVLDARGDNKCMSALMDLYPIFHRHGWYWGAEYSTEDAMHWEPADETFRGWIAGTIPAPTPYTAKPRTIIPALIVGGHTIPAQMLDGKLCVPARPACTALGIPCDYLPPAALQFGGMRLHGRMLDGRLYVAARALCDVAKRPLRWDAAARVGRVA